MGDAEELAAFSRACFAYADALRIISERFAHMNERIKERRARQDFIRHGGDPDAIEQFEQAIGVTWP